MGNNLNRKRLETKPTHAHTADRGPKLATHAACDRISGYLEELQTHWTKHSRNDGGFWRRCRFTSYKTQEIIISALHCFVHSVALFFIAEDKKLQSVFFVNVLNRKAEKFMRHPIEALKPLLPFTCRAEFSCQRPYSDQLASRPCSVQPGVQ